MNCIMESSPKKLYRSSSNRVIAGVAGGLGEYFAIDPLILRLLFVLLVIFGGSGIIVYLILWILIPGKEDTISDILHTSDTTDAGTEEAKTVHASWRSYSRNTNSRRGKLISGGLIIIVGLLFLSNAYGLFFFDFSKIWPLFIVLFGFVILLG